MSWYSKGLCCKLDQHCHMVSVNSVSLEFARSRLSHTRELYVLSWFPSFYSSRLKISIPGPCRTFRPNKPAQLGWGHALNPKFCTPTALTPNM